MLGSFGPLEIGLILLIVLVIFGANRLPEIGGAIGKSIKGFKKSLKEPEDNDATSKHDKDKT